MRANVTKTVLYCSVPAVLLLLYNSILYTKYDSDIVFNKLNVIKISTEELQDVTVYKVNKSDKELNLKYILQWTSPNTVPFVYMGKGSQGFIERNCSFTNCIVTANRTYLDDYTQFDAILFAAPELIFISNYLPKRRSPHQKYVFATIESAANYPVCTYKFDGFFNWTWTYRLDSDAKWGYIAIRNHEKKLIGPKENMSWMKLEDMDPVSEDVKDKIKNKSKAAAWFVSNCNSQSEREAFTLDLQTYLNIYDLKIDVYGDCGTFTCSRDTEDACNKIIENDYYFYLAFENSFAEDYVTEKLLYALKNYVVPIVYGGANYSRFMPDGIYLNARELGAEKLAKKMNELIEYPDLYAEYFKWRNHYSYHKRSENEETDDYCRFCSILNEADKVEKFSVYEHFKEWWDAPNRC